MAYDHKAIEKKWQHYWEEHKTFKTSEDPDKKKFYALDMFPYPSGQGLHVGHPEGYTATDIISRMKRMQGYDVLHPMGWDAFGLPAENYAIKMGVHPAVSTAANIKNIKRQINDIAASGHNGSLNKCTRKVLHTKQKFPSTGARNSERSLPMKKSSTARRNAAGILSSGNRCVSGF